MNFEKQYFRFSLKEVSYFVLFILVFLGTIGILSSILFGGSDVFTLSGLTGLIIISTSMLIPYFYNKKGVLHISDFSNAVEVLDIIDKGLKRRGLIVMSEDDGIVSYDKKTKSGRLLSHFFLEKAKVVRGEDEIKVYSIRKLLTGIEYEVKRVKGLLPA